MAKLDEQEPRKSQRRTEQGGPSGPKSELRGRDLIYIDTDDDVTSIVGRIKASEEVVVALVPPKRIGVLQSVVNLRLLQRAAKNAHKRLAIVTTDPALMNLASGLAIPVAKNINAQAKVLEVSDDDDISDVIDGNDIAVDATSRRSASGSKSATEDKEISAAVAAIETDDKIKNDLDADGVPDDQQEPKKSPKKKIKVPNVNSLRKKILIGGGLAVVLIGFLVWAIVFAPSATITIQAKTSAVEVKKSLSLVPSGDKDAAEGVLPPVVKQKKTNESVEFEATGSREVGEMAAGTVAFCYETTRNDPNSDELRRNSITLPAGTRLYANGVQFVTDAELGIEGGWNNAEDKQCETYYSIKATAVNIGEEGNIKQNTVMSVSGYSGLTALAKTDFTGGSKETVKVVQQSDVDAAVAKLREKGDSDAVRDELMGQMSDSTMVIDGSFSVSQGEVKVTPGVGETPEGDSTKATASIELTYTLVGVNRDDLSKVLDAQLKSQTDEAKQKVYNNGLDEAKFSGFTTTDNGYTVSVTTNGHVGPVIDEDEVKQQAVGKKSEEIKELLKQTDGVNDVSVTMSPFWVSAAPKESKITVNFEINE